MKPAISTDPRLLAVLAHFSITPDDTDTVNDSGHPFLDFLVREAVKAVDLYPDDADGALQRVLMVLRDIHGFRYHTEEALRNASRFGLQVCHPNKPLASSAHQRLENTP